MNRQLENLPAAAEHSADCAEVPAGAAAQDIIVRPLYLRIPPEQIVCLKFILESYEGLCELRTLDPAVAVLLILAVKDTLDDVLKLLESLKSELDITYLP